MIELGEITAAISALIHSATGVFAVDERMRTAVYPSVIVDAKELQTTIIAGGRQVLRKIGVRLACISSRDRERDETRELVYRVYAALLPYFSICGRKLAPADMATGGEMDCEISFTLEFCDLAPEASGRNTELMDRLDIRLGGQI